VPQHTRAAAHTPIQSDSSSHPNTLTTTTTETNRNPSQDAVVKGWFRTDPDPTVGATDLRRVALTALEVAGAMAYLHERGVLHGVSGRALSSCMLSL
jgi:hypothetical protein